MHHDRPRTAAEQMVDLGRIVSRLTNPYSVPIPVRDSSGAIRQAGMMHPPLIHQLRLAITRSSTSGSGGGGDPATKSVLNTDAYEKLAALRCDIVTAWTGLIPGLTTLPLGWSEEHALDLWLAMFRCADAAGLVSREYLDGAVTTFSNWTRVIQAQFDPPSVITNRRPCPVCGATYAIVDGQQVRAIQITVATLDQATATCRSCGHHWAGKAEIEQLRRDQHELSMLDPESSEAISDTPTNEKNPASQVDDALH